MAAASGQLATSPSRAVLEGGKAVEKKKKKAAKKVSTKKGKKIKTDDLIVNTVFAVENATTEESLERAKVAVESGNENKFQLGGDLFKISEEKLYAKLDYEKFTVYVADVIGLRPRTAYRLIDFYKAIVASEVKWAEVKDLGWTKLMVLSSVITKANAKKWIAAATKIKGYRALEELVAKAKAKAQPDEDPPASTSDVTSMTFKLHADQKEIVDMALDKAKEEGSTDVASVALEYICQDYLSGGDKPAAEEGAEVVEMTLAELMRNKTPAEVMDAFSEVWPEADVTIEM